MKIFSNRKLEIFEAVYLNGGISAAARELGLTQPTVSQHLRNMEGEIGLDLFRLEKGRLRPTLEAHKLFEMSSRATGHLARLDEVAADLIRGGRSKFNIVVVPNLPSDMISDIAADLIAEFPEITLSVAVSGGLVLTIEIREGAFDVGISGSLQAIPDMELTVLAVNRLVCLAHREHPISRLEILSLEQLSREEFVLPEKTGAMGKFLYSELDRREIVPLTRVVTYATHWIPSFIKKQKTVGILDLFSAKVALSPDLVIVPLDTQIEIPIQAVRKKNDSDSIYKDRFIELAREYFRRTLD